MLSKIWHDYSIWIVGCGMVVMIGVSIWGFFEFGGTLYKDLPQAEATINPVISPECRQKQLEEVAALAPYQVQLDAISEQESKLDERFSRGIPDGGTSTLLQMVGDA